MDSGFWVSHMNDPLVMAGVAVMLFGWVVSKFIKDHSARNKAFWTVFTIGVLLIAWNFRIAFKEAVDTDLQDQTNLSAPARSGNNR